MSLLSAEQTFESLDAVGTQTFAVRPGLPMSDLLELSSCRLSETIELLREQSEGNEGLSQNTIYIVQNQLVTAKALIDACSSGLLQGGAL